MRSRLLQRVHLAYLRKVQEAVHAHTVTRDNEVEARNCNGNNTSNSSQVLLLSGNKKNEEKPTAQYESGDAILTATSIRMSLAILQCLGPASKYHPPSLCPFAISLLCASSLILPLTTNTYIFFITYFFIIYYINYITGLRCSTQTPLSFQQSQVPSWTCWLIVQAWPCALSMINRPRRMH